jgi:type IV secretory pathway TrbF-like protein
VIPFVVEVDKLGYAITIPTALTASNTPATVERMKRYEIAAFIRNARFVSSDPAVEQNMLNNLLAHAPIAPSAIAPIARSGSHIASARY